MSIEVLLAKEDNVIFYCVDTKYLIRVVNMPDPDRLPKGGLLERSKIYGIKVEESPDFDLLKSYSQWPEIANIYQELDTIHTDEIEHHLILDEDEDLVNTIDTINMDSFHSIGNYQYHTEFNKIFYKNR